MKFDSLFKKFSRTKEDKKPKQQNKQTNRKILSKKDVPIFEKTADILKVPRITEKAARMSENGVYMFEVLSDATKKRIRHAVALHYRVTPVRVRTARIPGKPVHNRRSGIRGRRVTRKIAFVQLKKGDTIVLT